MWGTWFGGGSAQQRKDAPKKAILDLRQQLDMLQKREKHLENQMAAQDKIARDNVQSNKAGGSTPSFLFLLGMKGSGLGRVTHWGRLCEWVLLFKLRGHAPLTWFQAIPEGVRKLTRYLQYSRQNRTEAQKSA